MMLITGIVLAVSMGVMLAMLVGDMFMASRSSLVFAKPGDVFNFTYEQPLLGTKDRHLAKVIEVATLSDDAIARLNSRSNYRRNDPSFQRTNHLITAQTVNGQIRNFYAERCRNASKPPLGRLLFSLLD